MLVNGTVMNLVSTSDVGLYTLEHWAHDYRMAEWRRYTQEWRPFVGYNPRLEDVTNERRPVWRRHGAI